VFCAERKIGTREWLDCVQHDALQSRAPSHDSAAPAGVDSRASNRACRHLEGSMPPNELAITPAILRCRAKSCFFSHAGQPIDPEAGSC